jgi:type II secretory pathway component PulF
MVYPLLVLIAAFLLSCFLAYTSHHLITTVFAGTGLYMKGTIDLIMFGPWASPAVLGVLIVLVLVAGATPWMRRGLRWRVPAFREASLAQIASALSLMLKSGISLDDALALVVQLERGTRAEPELRRWRQNLAAGRGKFSEVSAEGNVFPPLFVWMVGHSGEDLPAGFQRVAETYNSRALYSSDLLLYSALPCAILGLGFLIVMQIIPVFTVMVRFMNQLSGN